MDMIACMKVGADKFLDGYAPGAGGTKRNCSKCKCVVWMAPSMKEVEDGGAVICCQECALSAAAEQAIREPTSIIERVITDKAAEEIIKLNKAREAFGSN